MGHASKGTAAFVLLLSNFLLLAAHANRADISGSASILSTDATGGCIDTPGFTNGHGYNCASYASKGWCANGGAAAGNEWTLGAEFKYPENNCCVCGKPAIESPTAASTGAPTKSPTAAPTEAPTKSPTKSPTGNDAVQNNPVAVADAATTAALEHVTEALTAAPTSVPTIAMVEPAHDMATSASGKHEKVKFPFPDQATAETEMPPQAKKETTTVAGVAGRSDTVRAGIRDGAWLGQDSAVENCLWGPLTHKFQQAHSQLGGWLYIINPPGLGKSDMVTETFSVAGLVQVNLYTVQAAQALKIQTGDGKVSVQFDFCREGYFNTNQLYPGDKEKGKYDGFHMKNTPGMTGAASGVAIRQAGQTHIKQFIFMQRSLLKKGHGDHTLKLAKVAQVLVMLDTHNGTSSVSHYSPKLSTDHWSQQASAGVTSMTSIASGRNSSNVHIFVAWAISLLRHAVPNDKLPSEGYIYQADVSSLTKGKQNSCQQGEKCEVKFMLLHTTKAQPMAMAVHLASPTTLDLYVAQWEMMWSEIGKTKTLVSASNLAVLDGVTMGESLWKKHAAHANMRIIAGQWLHDDIRNVQQGRDCENGEYQPNLCGFYKKIPLSKLFGFTSRDGVGTAAHFAFMDVISNRENLVNLNPYNGVSILVAHDHSANRTYVMIAEGPGHKLRMVDVSNKAASQGKVTTMVPSVGPLSIGLGRSVNDLFIVDSHGVLSRVDLQPVVMCGNQNQFFHQAFSQWKPGPFEGSTHVGPANHTYFLKRLAAGDDAIKKPWEAVVQKKIIEVKAGKHRALVEKRTSCTRPQSDQSESYCCVTKMPKLASELPVSPEEAEVLNAAIQNALIYI